MLDTPIAIAFIYIFFISNIFGWGYLHEPYYFIFSSTIAILYLLSESLAFFKLTRFSTIVKIFLLLLFIAVSVFATTANIMWLRSRTAPINYISDSALQAEIAGKFVLLGLNPYVKDYDNTDLAKWPYLDAAGRTLNPALYYNVIPPFLIVASSMGFAVFSQIPGFFDLRLILLAAYFSLLVMGFLKYRFTNAYALFLVLVCLNPLFTTNLIRGTNDVVVVALLLWSLYFLEAKKYLPSAILLGISIAAKQSAWFVVPLYLLYSYRHLVKKQFFQFTIISLLVGFAFYAPFLLDNFDRVYKSLVFYPSSHAKESYTTHPIEGYGFGSFVYTAGIVDSIYAPFPFWYFQLGVGLPVLLLLLFIQRKNISSSSLLQSAAVVTAIVWFFNRYFLESHIAYLLVLTAASYVWTMKKSNA